MSNHIVAIFLYCLVGLNIAAALVTVARVGKDGKPITPGFALYTVLAAGAVCTLEIIAAGRLLS